MFIKCPDFLAPVPAIGVAFVLAFCPRFELPTFVPTYHTIYISAICKQLSMVPPYHLKPLYFLRILASLISLGISIASHFQGSIQQYFSCLAFLVVSPCINTKSFSKINVHSNRMIMFPISFILNLSRDLSHLLFWLAQYT